MDKVLGRLGVESLSQMQLDTSDAVLHTDRDIVVLSPTGSIVGGRQGTRSD